MTSDLPSVSGDSSAPTPNTLLPPDAQQQVLSRAIARVRASLSLETVFDTTATEVCQLLQADRVAIFRFDPDRDWEGEFVSESVGEEWDSAMAKKVYDHCFGEQFAPQYTQGQVQAVADIEDAGLSDCHRDILSQFQVRANLIVPVLQDEELWGLLCVHQCGEARAWQSEEIEFVKLIAEHLSVAIQQANLLAQAHQKTEQQRALTRAISRIRQSLNLAEIFQTTVTEVRQLLQADRVAVFRFDPDRDWEGEFVSESVGEEWDSAMAKKVYDHCFGEQFAPQYAQGQVQAVADIEDAGLSDCHRDILSQFQVRANFITPLLLGDRLWGLLCIHQCSAPRLWQELDIQFAQQVAEQLGVALTQCQYIAQVQKQAGQLAEANEREKAAEKQKLLAVTIEKIRQSLDIETIFQTTTQEVRQLLQVERVAIYRFNPDWSGEFVADSIEDGWLPQPISQSAIAASLSQADTAGKYPRNEAFVPISQRETLWGLLVAYQNSHPRYWQDEEMNLLAQIGVQLGIAIQQAELLKQTRQQATELSQALQKLQATQTQLIQGEKMASLGQLVAGVAHEINNPVNFIYGNLSHITTYLEELLRLIALYQKHYPKPATEIQEEAEAVDLEFICQDLPKTLSSMQVGAERIRQIVLSLRTFARLDESDKKPIDIHEGIDSTLLILQHRLKAASDRSAIEVVKDYGSLPPIQCYASQLNQVFMNILSNGIDALEEAINSQEGEKRQPVLKIRTRVEGQHVDIRIADNGAGMPPEVREKAFNPFFTTKSASKGTGLGLSISYQIVVEKHGGRLSCTSQSGEGTQFLIEIPF